ncbi:transcription factor bHLH95-like [Bidens hawaiensis]|uniref:transcription factor bHLH95-like n=1 Tax=Bidens hawaiensis TaxID=980011 RepID=UPI004049FB2D
MDEKGGLQEGLFRQTLRWAMSNNSGSGDRNVAPVAINGGAKRKHGGVMIKTENDQESDGEDGKWIRDPEPCEHVKHLLTEKKRRKKMSNMFQELHGLLPKQTPKAKLLTIVDDAITYIKNLQQSLQDLEIYKQEMLNHPSPNTSVNSFITPPQNQTAVSFFPNAGSSSNHSDNIRCPNFGPFSFPLRLNSTFQTWVSSNVTLNVCGQDAFLNICCPKKHELLTAIYLVLEKCKLDIVSSQISGDQATSLLMIHVRVNAPDVLAAFSCEEVYKLAAAEIIMLLVNSMSP